MKSVVYSFLLFFIGTIAVQAQIAFDLVERVDVEPVWSGHPVGCDLLTEGDLQFAAYYDAERNLVVAKRKLDEKEWTFKRLPTKIGWDSHNYVTMTLDRDKFLHVSGNMHCVPLIYFRSEKPLDIESLAQVASMTGENEKRCTYPRFVTGPNKELLFTYRDGSSGNGNQIWNIYDPDKKIWSRLLDKPLFDGQGKMNAYFHPPVVGPDGFYHMTWVWRNTPDCATNHDISYARSKDLRHWENSRGEPYKLPITLETGEIIDPVPVKGGLLNPLQRIGFDLDGRVVVSYSKYDTAGNFQICNARLESDGWKSYQTSDWDYRWEFSGGGSIIGEVGFGPVEIENGKLTQSYSHAKKGGGRWLLDSATLKPIGKAPSPVRWPKEIGKVELDFPGVQGRSAWDDADQGKPYEKGQIRYTMRWESLPTNRDRPHPTTPPPSLLRVFKLRSN